MYPANSYSIRQATEADAATLRRLAVLDGQKPFAPTQLLRMRLAAPRVHSGAWSLPERLEAAMRPFNARVAGA